jgi:hypothetical protein
LPPASGDVLFLAAALILFAAALNLSIKSLGRKPPDFERGVA